MFDLKKLLFQLTLVLFSAPLFAQLPGFRGIPFMIEECRYEINSAGNAEPSASLITIYAFDAEGRLVEQWLKSPGMSHLNKLSDRHTVFEYTAGRLYKSTEYNSEGEPFETIEHFYDKKGALVRTKKTASSRLFSHEVSLVLDSLGRTLQQNIRFEQAGKAPLTTYFEYFGDTLVISTTKDPGSQVQSVHTYRHNASGDLLQTIETDGAGIEQVNLQNSYRYDSTGNWIERNSTFRSTLLKSAAVNNSKTIRRIVYRKEQPKELSADHLLGTWANFHTGLQLDFFADGTYLARINGRKKDGGAWALDTPAQTLSVTGKEHRTEAVPLRFRWENGFLHLTLPDQSGVNQLIKLD